MPRSGAATRERILDCTQALVYDHGFTATTIDKVIARAAVTKGAFFYHFDSKAGLGRSLVQRYAERDIAHLQALVQGAETATSDPVERVLVLIGFLREHAATLTDPVPGCLFASYLYERLEYPADVADIAAETMVRWRDIVAAKLEAAIEAAGVQDQVEPRELAETLISLIEGGYVLAKATGDATVPARQLDHFRTHLALLLLVARAKRETA